MREPTTTMRMGGFSIVELMVSVVIGLLALVFATRMIATAELSKQSALGGSDAMQNGMLALFSMHGDASQAGWGLNDPLLVGCDTVFADSNGYVMPTVVRSSGVVATTVRPISPVLITSNGAAPDTITFYSGTSMSGTGTLRLTNNYVAGTVLEVDRPNYGFAIGDVFVVAPETRGASRCSLSMISNFVSGATQQLTFAAGGVNRFNSGSLGLPFGSNLARLFNLGPATTLSFHTWSVLSGYLRLSATDLAGSAPTPITVVDNIVSIKAQYGLDTRVGAAFTPTSGMQVSVWSNTMIDADGDLTAAGAGDFERIAAVRIAVVARSRAPEKPNGSGLCSATTAQPVVFGSAEPAGVTAVPITVSVAVAGDSVDWHCYRYRVFETIVPLRNAGWRPTS
ncbi:MAG: PilW family protein [Pseudomonadota bacterium]